MDTLDAQSPQVPRCLASVRALRQRKRAISKHLRDREAQNTVRREPANCEDVEHTEIATKTYSAELEERLHDLQAQLQLHEGVHRELNTTNERRRILQERLRERELTLEERDSTIDELDGKIYALTAKEKVQSQKIEELEQDLKREMWNQLELNDAHLNLQEELENAKAQIQYLTTQLNAAEPAQQVFKDETAIQELQHMPHEGFAAFQSPLATTCFVEPTGSGQPRHGISIPGYRNKAAEIGYIKEKYTAALEQRHDSHQPALHFGGNTHKMAMDNDSQDTTSTSPELERPSRSRVFSVQELVEDSV
ncbi:hypothetical protein PtrSN002B_009048 [Pyrenophora tritici-repentis]|uniref:Exonuc-VII-L multi-domain protein n=2 Tax=Pyrenophora tritici-repentis TaxID=45151 RepID=A0A2W1HKK6_9PLEO|nr:uncharacterized protein PTRG_02588 [Pyrenophora tritici-repentis Pt-1C-BFP]KAA8623355.1 Exonuc-VII-L multi-domain protein [Pyrenophora tritici-repentis]EDU45111.1 predicted protein [Pyrenophora tritici-repentis Pt-1C-BFP]KAF7452359.1 Exonuc VII L multi-domain protein [Pyrenophora tritici-repentis]KAF7574519.1 Trichoplein multi-domain protein [Pyrenophora tritici-repentis]KAG9386699.1 Exonuc VII L multi-domain protein [Pyrenophora tritici-repentis]